MADENNAPSVDETPISPIDRRNSLEKHLQTRPDPQDLKNRNILLDSNAAPYAKTKMIGFSEVLLISFSSLQAAQHDLERQRATDSLKKGLDKRPDREELIERRLPALVYACHHDMCTLRTDLVIYRQYSSRLHRSSLSPRPAEGTSKTHAPQQPRAEIAEQTQAGGVGSGGHFVGGRESYEVTGQGQ